MIGTFTRRGQPLIALILVLGSWVSARAMMFDASEIPLAPPFAIPSADAASPIATRRPSLGSEPEPAPPVGLSRAPLALFEPDYSFLSEMAPAPVMYANPATQAPADAGKRHLSQDFAPVGGWSLFPNDASNELSRAMAPLKAAQPRSRLAALQPDSAAPQSADPAGQEPQNAGSRWSADSWMLWRRGSRTRLAGGVLTPSYGASQAGSVLRYRLMRNNAHRPSAYLRITTALDSSAEREASLGLSARPFARIPLVAAAEARLTSTPGGRMIRPAGFIVTELPPLALPLGLRGEAYGQAGYVGGKFATPFADGQLRADRALLILAEFNVRLGAGLWGGAQKGASRLDAGPSLTVGRPLGGSASMRLAADWRFRVAGKAAPGSGPAVTLSAGF